MVGPHGDEHRGGKKRHAEIQKTLKQKELDNYQSDYKQRADCNNG